MPPPVAKRPIQRTPSELARIEALKSLLEQAERRGLALSPQVQQVVENQSIQLFDYYRDRTSAINFSRTLKETAVRLFRQRRYRESDARYRLASHFNPNDSTLVSNRATCMYNLARYHRCIDLCLDCINAFPRLAFDNPMLYCKILLRMGRANIELDNFEEATATFDALTAMRTDLYKRFGAQIPEEQFNALMVPFERHLRAKMSCFEQNQSRSVQSASNASRSNRRNRGEDNRDDTDDSDGEDENLYGYVQLTDLCCHIFPNAKGRCDHPYADYPASRRNTSPVEEEYGEPDLAHSENDSFPPLASTDNEDDGASTDSNMPDLVSDEEEYSDSADDESVEEDVSLNTGSPVIATESLPNSSHTHADTQSLNDDMEITKSTSMQLSGDSVSTNEPEKQLPSTPSQTTTVTDGIALKAPKMSPPSPSVETGFKRGFLTDSSRSVPASPGRAPGASTGSNKTISEADYPKLSSRDKDGTACYESDEEKGPLTVGLHEERTREDRAIMRKETTMKAGQKSHTITITNVLREVMGRTFQNGRTIDFTRIFGHHVVALSNSKRKKKSCDKNCGTCFARKMWRQRFVSTELSAAEAAIASMEKDRRKDLQTYLSTDLWQRTGFYGSGYEMAYDVPGLVHGVAYMCHLQSELHWRGDKVTFLKDAQHSFFSSLERNHQSHPNLEFLFMIFMLIRDTVNLFGLFPDPRLEDRELSFQFSRSAAGVAALTTSANEGYSDSNEDEMDILPGINSDNLSRNLHTWGRVGQVAKEEEWIYHILLRDVSHLITKLTNPAPMLPMHLEEGDKSFSEAFDKACGERARDEKYWRVRIVTIIARERHRMIERLACDFEEAGDIETSDQLFSGAVAARPRQARLFLKRAQLRARQKYWDDALSDIQTSIRLAGEHRHIPRMSTRCNHPVTCLMIDSYALECDIFFAKALEERDSNRNGGEMVKMAIQSVTKALELKPLAERKRRSLQDRLDVAQCFLSGMETITPMSASISKSVDRDAEGATLDSLDVGKRTQRPDEGRNVFDDDEEEAFGSRIGSKGKGSTRRKKRKAKKTQQKPRADPAPAPPQQESASSSDEGEGSALTGNPYAALLDNGQGTLQEAHQTPKSTPPLTRGSVKRDSSPRNPRLPKSSQREAQPTPQVPGIHSSEASPSTQSPSPSPSVDCVLCGLKFSGQSDYDSHVSSRRHRMAVAHASAAGQSPTEWGSRNSHSTQSSSPWLRAVTSRPAIVATERPQISSGVPGPTREEVLAEVERAIALLGGEGRPCDIIPRMRLWKWHIRDVSAYVERQFGGLLRLCLQGTRMFQMRPGTESRPVLVWVDPNDRALNNVENQSESTSLRTSTSTPADGDRRPSLSPSLTQMLRDQLRLSSMNRRRGDADQDADAGVHDRNRIAASQHAAADGPGECGICYDNVPDIRLIPCGHQWCTPCIAENIIDRKRDECPVCRQTVERTELLGELD